MELFEIDQYRLKIHPLAYQLKPFADLLNRDTSEDKKLAIAEITAVFFFADYKSDFASVLDESERWRLIKHYVVGLGNDWKPDSVVEEAIKFYKKQSESVTSRLYESALVGLDKLDKHIRNVNFSDVDKSGKPKYNAKQYNEMLKGFADTVASLKKMEDLVLRERETKNSLRGGREKGMFED